MKFPINLVLFCVLIIESDSSDSSKNDSNCLKILKFYSIDQIKSAITIRNLKELYSFMSSIWNKDDDLNEVDLSCMTNLELFMIQDSKLTSFSTLNDFLISFNFPNDNNKTVNLKIRFLSLKKIRYLSVSHSALKSFTNQMILHFKNVNDLFFSGGSLISWDPKVFNGFKSLSSLNIQLNAFNSTRIFRFNESKLNFLSQLSLTNNRIEIVESNSFMKLFSLKELDLSRNYIETIEADAFSNLNNLVVLNLNHNSIKSLVANAFRGLFYLRKLILVENEIAYIQSRVFNQIKNLEFLSLTYNYIFSLSNIEIERLRFFKYLNIQLSFLKETDNKNVDCNQVGDVDVDIDGNEIDVSKINSIGCFRNLKAVSLNRNKISKNNQQQLKINLSDVLRLDTLLMNEIEMKNLTSITLTSKIKRINTLSLIGNKLNSIQNMSFSGFPNLKALKLNSNQISSIENICLNGLESLELLDLSSNGISSISSVTAIGLSNLKTLVLWSNLIESIEYINFKGLESLQVLELFLNRIKTIDMVNIEGILALNKLNLGGNQIESIRNVTFRGVNQLKALSLSINRIQNLSHVVFNGIENLKQLDLSENKKISLSNNTINVNGLKNLNELKLNHLFIYMVENLTFKGLEKLTILDLSFNYINKLDSISIRGLNNLKLLNLTRNEINSIENPVDICCLNQSDLYTVILYENLLNEIRPNKFPINYRISINNQIQISPYLAPVKIFFDFEIKYNIIYYQYPNSIDANKICQNKHLFQIKNSKFLKSYQSIPFQLYDHHEKVATISCSMLFAFYRKCFLMRYLFGYRYEFESFVENCKTEKLDPFYRI